MATTFFVGSPLSAEFPASNFPQLLLTNRRPALAFDASTDETAYWTLVAPQALTGTMSLVLYYAMASATANAIGFQAQIEAITPGDGAPDTDSATSFDSVNNSASTTVPSTAGLMQSITITMTNQDSIAAGDLVRLSINRDADGSAITDSAAGDAYILGVELRF